MKKLLIIQLLAFLLASCGESYRHPMESELARIDKALESMDKYVELKENRINTIMEPLADESLPLSQQYTIYGRLYEEYAPYQFDQARKMVEKQEQIAEQMGDASLKTTATLNKAFLLTNGGMYLEAHNTFQQLDTLTFDYQQKIQWWNTRQKFLSRSNPIR